MGLTPWLSGVTVNSLSQSQLVNIVSGNGLVLSSTKPLPESMLSWINEFSKTSSWMGQLGPKSLPQGSLLSPIMGVTPTLSGKIPNGKQCTPRLLNNPSMMAVGLSVGVWDMTSNWHHLFMIGWSKYKLVLPQLQWYVGSHDWWEFPLFFRGQWQFPCTTLIGHANACH